MAVARRGFFGGGQPGMPGDLGGNMQNQPSYQKQQGGMPTPPMVPPPTDPNMVAQQPPPGAGRGPTQPGNVDDLLQPQQQGPGQQGDPNQMDMGGSASVVMRLLKQMGQI